MPYIFCKAIQIYIDKGAKHKHLEWLKLRKIIFFTQKKQKIYFCLFFIIRNFFKIFCKTIISRFDIMVIELSILTSMVLFAKEIFLQPELWKLLVGTVRKET